MFLPLLPTGRTVRTASRGEPSDGPRWVRRFATRLATHRQPFYPRGMRGGNTPLPRVRASGKEIGPRLWDRGNPADHGRWRRMIGGIGPRGGAPPETT